MYGKDLSKLFCIILYGVRLETVRVNVNTVTP